MKVSARNALPVRRFFRPACAGGEQASAVSEFAKEVDKHSSAGEESIIICTDSGMTDHMNVYLAKKAGSFTVYFTKELAERLFAEDHQGL